MQTRFFPLASLALRLGIIQRWEGCLIFQAQHGRSASTVPVTINISCHTPPSLSSSCLRCLDWISILSTLKEIVHLKMTILSLLPHSHVSLNELALWNRKAELYGRLCYNVAFRFPKKFQASLKKVSYTGLFIGLLSQGHKCATVKPDVKMMGKNSDIPCDTLLLSPSLLS